jgi:hypothetical protein
VATMIVAMGVSLTSLKGPAAGTIAAKSAAALAGAGQTDPADTVSGSTRVQSDIRTLLDAVRRARLEERRRLGSDQEGATARLAILDSIEKAAGLLPSVLRGAGSPKSSVNSGPVTGADLRSLEQVTGRLVSHLQRRGGTGVKVAETIGSIQKLQDFHLTRHAALSRPKGVRGRR